MYSIFHFILLTKEEEYTRNTFSNSMVQLTRWLEVTIILLLIRFYKVRIFTLYTRVCLKTACSRMCVTLFCCTYRLEQ